MSKAANADKAMLHKLLGDMTVDELRRVLARDRVRADTRRRHGSPS